MKSLNLYLPMSDANEHIGALFVTITKEEVEDLLQACDRFNLIRIGKGPKPGPGTLRACTIVDFPCCNNTKVFEGRYENEHVCLNEPTAELVEEGKGVSPTLVLWPQYKDISFEIETDYSTYESPTVSLSRTKLLFNDKKFELELNLNGKAPLWRN